MLLRRLRKLELTLANSSSQEDSRAVRLDAYDRLEHPDRIAIAHLARRSNNGEDVEVPPEMRPVMARWDALIADVVSQNGQGHPRARGEMN